MSVGRFVLNFLCQKTRTEADIEHLRPYFLDYEPDMWNAEVNGGAFKFIANDGIKYNCLIVHSNAHGICLMFDIWNRKFISGKTTVGNLDRMREMTDVGIEETYPVGCFISPNEAWPLVESFLLNPTVYPESKYLKDLNEIEW